jgi:hypothetical protein
MRSRGWIIPLATTLSGLTAFCQEPVEFEFKNVSATIAKPATKTFEYYHLQFDLVLTNRTDKALSVPAEPQPARLFIGEMSKRESNGSWIPFWRSEPVPFKNSDYSTCTPLTPGGSRTFTGRSLELRFEVYRGSTLSGAQKLKMSVYTPCKDPAGNYSLLAGETAAFDVQVPSPTK